MAKQEILKGHKRVGKRLIPPFLQMVPLQETSYVNQLLPHLMWMGLLNDLFGYREGISLATDFAKLVHGIHVSDKHVNFAMCGRYAVLTDEECSAITVEADRKGLLTKLRAGLGPLLFLHPNCPLES